MGRKTGHYWVKESGCEWEIAIYISSRGVWRLTGASGDFYDSYFDEIDENRIERKCN